jgi:hypothetical protein
MKTEILWMGLFLMSAVTCTWAGGQDIPISTLPFTISAPGKYYLTGSLRSAGHGLEITASDVMVDLRGFDISSSAGIRASSVGVLISGSKVTVQNGSITGFNIGLQSGSPGSTLLKNTFKKLKFNDCGAFALDIFSNQTVVDFCQINGIGLGVTDWQIAGIRSAGDGNSITNNTVARISPIEDQIADGIVITQGLNTVLSKNAIQKIVAPVTTVLTVPGFDHPIVCEYCPVNGYIYVADKGSTQVDGRISVYDPVTNAIVATIAVPNLEGHSNVNGVRYNANDQKIYASSWGNGFSTGALFKIDPLTNTIAATVNFPSGAGGAADNSLVFDQNFVWISSYNNYLMKINTTTNSIVSTVIVPNAGYALALTSFGSKLWMGCHFTTNVLAYDTGTLQFGTAAANSVTQIVSSVVVGSKLYFGARSGIYPVNTASNSLGSSIFSSDIYSLSTDGTWLYSSSHDGIFRKIDPATNTVVASRSGYTLTNISRGCWHPGVQRMFFPESGGTSILGFSGF